MANVRLILLLEALAQLERDTTTVVRHADALVTSGRSTEVAHLRAALDQAVLSMRDLRRRTLDNCTDIAVEHQELCLRTRAAVVLMQLADLREVEAELPPGTLRVRGRFQRVHDLATFLLDRIGRVNGRAATARREVERAKDLAHDRSARQARYGLILTEADRSFTALGSEPDVVAFLEAGELVASERFRFACSTIAMVLDGDDVQAATPFGLRGREPVYSGDRRS